MGILRLAAQNVGPFRELNVDFSDGKGNPHLGPHIFAGVNGSGKTSILKSIALMCNQSPGPIDHHEPVPKKGFDFDSFDSICTGGAIIGAEHSAGLWPFTAIARKNSSHFEAEKWARGIWPDDSFNRLMPPETALGPFALQQLSKFKRLISSAKEIHAVAYSPGIRLQHSSRQQFSGQNIQDSGDLSFESTVDNIATQQWIVDLFSRKAIAQQAQKQSTKFDSALQSINDAIASIYGAGSQLEIDVDALEPRIRLFGRTLNFSQLPQGVASTLGWIVDFTRRRMRNSGSWQQYGGILMIDEIEAYLHPKWQRKILPALQKGLPGVQIIVASHSPFVIASCPDARIHMLDLNETTGEASYQGAHDAPVGKSVNSVLKDIFGVESRFDVQAEDELNELNELRRLSQMGKLSKAQQLRSSTLAENLSQRSEELRFLIGPSLSINDKEKLETRFLPTATKPAKVKRIAKS
jgi:predicted ATP-binding protein involved in virulence